MHWLLQYVLVLFPGRWIDSNLAQSHFGAQSVVDAAQQKYRDRTIAVLTNNSIDSPCTLDTIRVRYAWDDISIDQRAEYLAAVKCVTEMPARTSRDLAPGVRTHYDDFVYTHITHSDLIHGSAYLLPWHRQFIWFFEETLRNQCNYTGTVPYWPWERHAHNQSASPVFQDSAYSFGTNGDTSSGGCVTNGPLSSHTANIGPYDTTVQQATLYNPHCVTRNFQQHVSTANLTHSILSSLYQTNTIEHFQPELELRFHAGAHLFINGEMYNLGSSTNDFIFWLVHAQMDRVWTIWQNQDWDARKAAVHGTLTMINVPPSERGTVDSPMNMGFAGGDMRIGDAMDPIGGRYCYMYK